MKKKIYIIALEGPEWTNSVEAHTKKKKAKARVYELQNELDAKKNKNVYEELSGYVYYPLDLFKGK
jgi:hypothetical protein